MFQRLEREEERELGRTGERDVVWKEWGRGRVVMVGWIEEVGERKGEERRSKDERR